MTKPVREITEQEWKDYYEMKERFEQLKVDLKAAFEKSGMNMVRSERIDEYSDYLGHFWFEYKGYKHLTDLYSLVLDVFDIE